MTETHTHFDRVAVRAGTPITTTTRTTDIGAPRVRPGS